MNREPKSYKLPILVLPHTQEHWDLSQNINILKDENNWLEDAVPLDIYVSKSKRLVAINAKGERSAYCAIRDELKDRGIPLPDGEKPLVRLVNRFRDAHPLISAYLYKDMGVHLMNMDSKIMNAILMKLMDKGILGLSVYDSVIVAEQHQDYLNQVMIEEYKKEMGFKPKIG